MKATPVADALETIFSESVIPEGVISDEAAWAIANVLLAVAENDLAKRDLTRMDSAAKARKPS